MIIRICKNKFLLYIISEFILPYRGGIKPSLLFWNYKKCIEIKKNLYFSNKNLTKKFYSGKLYLSNRLINQKKRRVI